MAFFKGAAKEAQRASILKQQREKERQEIEYKKKKLESDLRIDEISSKFTVRQDTADQNFASETVGLVTLDELKAQQEALKAAKEKEELLDSIDEGAGLGTGNVNDKGPVSFCFDDEDNGGDEVVPVKKRRYGVNPRVDTTFIPDVYRKEEENKLREQLKYEWQLRQAAIKEQEMIIPYSYWDGSGHRREVTIKKGYSIQSFLGRCLEQLRREFPDLRQTTVDRLMYVRQDLIIPHHYSFYDLITMRARGRNGLLFELDDYECDGDNIGGIDCSGSLGRVRIPKDAVAADKQDAHDGKVCPRVWYEKNKHIFPASRWEPFDPEKKWTNSTGGNAGDRQTVSISRSPVS